LLDEEIASHGDAPPDSLRRIEPDRGGRELSESLDATPDQDVARAE
jgi:hypothetical protein